MPKKGAPESNRSPQRRAKAKPPESATPAPGRRPANGGWLNIGNPGNKGGGRTPDAFKQRMAELADYAARGDYIERCLAGEFGPDAFLKAQAFVSERGYGKVPQVTKLEGDESKPLVVRVVRS